MLALIFAIISTSLVAIMMRLGEAKARSKTGLVVSNYAVCVLVGGILLFRNGLPALETGAGFAAGYGFFGGFMFLYSMLVFQKSIARNGVVLSSTFTKLGVLVPTLVAILVFRVQPKLTQMLGIAVAVAAILIMNLSKGVDMSSAGKGLLIFLLLVSGSTDAMANIYDQLGVPAYKDLYLFVSFLFAFLFAVVLLLRKGERISLRDILCGICVGIPNYFSFWFIMVALRTVPAVVVFPAYSSAGILIVTAVGVLLFHEKLEKQKIAALVLILLALVLLNI